MLKVALTPKQERQIKKAPRCVHSYAKSYSHIPPDQIDHEKTQRKVDEFKVKVYEIVGREVSLSTEDVINLFLLIGFISPNDIQYLFASHEELYAYMMNGGVDPD